MISVGQKNLNPQVFQLRLRHPLDCAHGPYRHEDRRLHDPVRRVKKAGACSCCRILRYNLKSQSHKIPEGGRLPEESRRRGTTEMLRVLCVEA